MDFYQETLHRNLLLEGRIRPNSDEEYNLLNFRDLDGAVEKLKRREYLGVKYDCFNAKEAQTAREYLDRVHPEYAQQFQMTWMFSRSPDE